MKTIDKLKRLRDELKERYKQLDDLNFFSFQEEQEFKDYEHFISRLDAIIEGEGDGWISVDDRLPEQRKYVLAYHSRNSNSITNYLNENNEWMVEVNGITNDVTHWMPLPQPPKQS